MPATTSAVYFKSFQASSFPSTNCHRVVLLILAVSVLWAGSAHTTALQIRPLSIADLTKRSEVIALGTVISILSDWNAPKTTIYTRIDLQVEEVFKGAASKETISFYQLGGEVGNTASTVAGTAPFTRGERVVVFLYKDKEQRLQLTGSFQGKFSIEKRGPSEVEMVARRVPGLAKPLDEMPLERLELEIRRALAKQQGLNDICLFQPNV